MGPVSGHTPSGFNVQRMTKKVPRAAPRCQAAAPELHPSCIASCSPSSSSRCCCSSSFCRAGHDIFISSKGIVALLPLSSTALSRFQPRNVLILYSRPPPPARPWTRRYTYPPTHLPTYPTCLALVELYVIPASISTDAFSQHALQRNGASGEGAQFRVL